MARITESTKILIESGILVSLLSFSAWLGINSFKTEANAAQIESLQKEHQVLAKELVETQKQIIKEMAEIRTRLILNKGD